MSSGQARGDGIALEATTFELIPVVSARPTFSSTQFVSNATPETFRLETIYPDPFVPETTPLPNPDGYPPLSFQVYLSVGPSLSTAYPARVDGYEGVVFVMDSIVVDVPIIAHIDQAYILLSGPAIVPEPASVVLAGLAVLVGVVRNKRAGRARGGQDSSSGCAKCGE